MKILYIGGTGEISHACVLESLQLGHEVAVYNRGQRAGVFPGKVEAIRGELSDYSALRGRTFDVVCQFFAFDMAQIERDLKAFSGNAGQYVFISTASAYCKPMNRYTVVTEQTPLTNPYWEYSQKKRQMELKLLEWHAAGKLPATIVRPSHTYRLNFPTALGKGDWTARRMLDGKPVIVHGDGSSLWTLTHASDFARPFARLLGNKKALGEDFHITRDQPYTWDEIFHAMAAALGAEPKLVHVASETLIRYEPKWIGPLLGDKSPSTVFDNAKVKSVAGDFDCTVSLEAGMQAAAAAYLQRSKSGATLEAEVDVALYERIILEQQGLH
ncbi:MAG TPA: SDR family oxidoreductase [Gammaproteobacteria bacterium]|nr:SDR family oxidoreductase [Gammaproteobacteria bacterium]